MFSKVQKLTTHHYCTGSKGFDFAHRVGSRVHALSEPPCFSSATRHPDLLRSHGITLGRDGHVFWFSVYLLLLVFFLKQF